MNILDKLRKQSTENNFEVRLNKADAEELLRFYPTPNNTALDQMLIEKQLRVLNDPNQTAAALSAGLMTVIMPVKIDYNCQAVLDGGNLFAAFIRSNLQELRIVIEFVTSAPNTEND